MKAKTLAEWIAFYEKKTGETFKPHPSFKLLYFPNHGFCEISLEPSTKMVTTYQLCGDGHFWKNLIDGLARLLGFSHGGAICVRSIIPYIRYWGFKVSRTVQLSNGQNQYFCINKYGEKARCSPAWLKEGGEYAYFVTWEVNDNLNVAEELKT